MIFSSHRIVLRIHVSMTHASMLTWKWCCLWIWLILYITTFTRLQIRIFSLWENCSVGGISKWRTRTYSRGPAHFSLLQGSLSTQHAWREGSGLLPLCSSSIDSSLNWKTHLFISLPALPDSMPLKGWGHDVYFWILSFLQNAWYTVGAQ